MELAIGCACLLQYTYMHHSSRKVFSPSDKLISGVQLVACDSPAGRLGVTVCYDLRFPELYQRLRFQMGAEVMLVPSAFTKATGG